MTNRTEEIIFGPRLSVFNSVDQVMDSDSFLYIWSGVCVSFATNMRACVVDYADKELIRHSQ